MAAIASCSAAGSLIKRNADEYQHHGKHDDRDNGFHGYSLPARPSWLLRWSSTQPPWIGTPIGIGDEPQEMAAVEPALRGPEAQRRH